MLFVMLKVVVVIVVIVMVPRDGAANADRTVNDVYRFAAVVDRDRVVDVGQGYGVNGAAIRTTALRPNPVQDGR